MRNPANAVGNPEGVTSVLVLPINAAVDHTSGIDFNARYAWETASAGKFTFNLGYTYVIMHDIQLFKGDPVVDEITDYYDYVIPRNKANYSATWDIEKFSTTLYGQRLGGLPNYDGVKRLGATFNYNWTFNYRVTPRASLSFDIENVFDSQPGKDSTWTSYPYYASRWFSPVGRAYYFEVTYRFGGSDGH